MSIFGLFKNPQPKDAVDQSKSSGYDYENLKSLDVGVAGVHYHKSEIKRLATINPDWNVDGRKLAAQGKTMSRIYHYCYQTTPVRLEIDSKDKTNPGGVKVIIAGSHVGYISQDNARLVKQLLKTNRIKRIDSAFKNHECKVVSENGDSVINKGNLSIRLTIQYSS